MHHKGQCITKNLKEAMDLYLKSLDPDQVLFKIKNV
jgi:hypothetical protein